MAFLQLLAFGWVGIVFIILALIVGSIVPLIGAWVIVTIAAGFGLTWSYWLVFWILWVLMVIL